MDRMYTLFWTGGIYLGQDAPLLQGYEWVDIGDVMGLEYDTRLWKEHGEYSPELLGIQEHDLSDFNPNTGRYAFVPGRRMSFMDWCAIEGLA